MRIALINFRSGFREKFGTPNFGSETRFSNVRELGRVPPFLFQDLEIGAPKLLNIEVAVTFFKSVTKIWRFFGLDSVGLGAAESAPNSSALRFQNSPPVHKKTYTSRALARHGFSTPRMCIDM